MDKIKHTLKLRYAVLLTVLVMLVTGALSQVARAAGTASFTLTPNSGTYSVGSAFTVTVYETSQASDNVEGVQANLTYNAANLRCDSVSVSDTAFTYQAQKACSGGTVNIGEAAGSTVSGQQLVGIISFTVLGAGSASVSIASGSDIQNSSQSSVWSGTKATATFTLANPAPSGGGGSGSSGGAPTKTPVASGSTDKSSGSNSGPAHPQTSTAAPTTTPTSTSQGGGTATTTLAVTVTDASGKPIVNAKVVVANRYSEYTDAQGKAGFSNLPGGTYNVTVSASGQKTSQTKVTLTPNETKQISLKLAGATSKMSLAILAAVGAVVLLGAVIGLARFSRWRSGVERHRSKGAITPGIVLGGTDSTPAASAPSPVPAPAPTPMPTPPPQDNSTEVAPTVEPAPAAAPAPAPAPAQSTPPAPASTPVPNVVTPQVATPEPTTKPPEDKPLLG